MPVSMPGEILVDFVVSYMGVDLVVVGGGGGGESTTGQG